MLTLHPIASFCLLVVSAVAAALQPDPAPNPGPRVPPPLIAELPLMAPVSHTQVQDEPAGIRAFSIEHADAGEVVDLLQQLLNGEYDSCVTDARTQQIFVRAEHQVLERAAKLIASLDRRVEDGRETVLLTTQYRRVSELQHILEMSSDHDFYIDEARNVIVIKDSPEAIQRTRELLVQLDRPTADLSVSFMVLGQTEEPLPETSRMKKVSQELEALGLRGYGILSRAAVITQEHDNFSIDGMNDAGTLNISGSIHLLGGEERRAELELDIRVSVESTGGEAHVESTVKVPLDHLFIVGITPAGGSANHPLVIVTEAKELP